MEISLFNSVPRQIGIVGITAYQNHISPHKGFACAHRVLYGGESCSQYIKQVIAKESLRVAFIKSRARFQACKEANLILRSQTDNTEPTKEEDPSNPENAERLKRKLPLQSSHYGNGCFECSDCASGSCDCCRTIDHYPQFHCGIADCSSDHCSLPDCGSWDCSGVDCSSLDCGSCSN